MQRLYLGFRKNFDDEGDFAGIDSSPRIFDQEEVNSSTEEELDEWLLVELHDAHTRRTNVMLKQSKAIH